MKLFFLIYEIFPLKKKTIFFWSSNLSTLFSKVKLNVSEKLSDTKTTQLQKTALNLNYEK